MYTEVPLFTLKDLHPRHTEADRLKKKKASFNELKSRNPKNVNNEMAGDKIWQPKAG